MSVHVVCKAQVVLMDFVDNVNPMDFVDLEDCRIKLLLLSLKPAAGDNGNQHLRCGLA